jgi:rod shape-determining protein MreD
MNRERICFFITYALLSPSLLIIEYACLGNTKGLDIPLALALSAGWFNPFPVSGVIGFGIGLIQDLFVGRVLGFSALCLSLVSMLMSQVRGFLNPSMPFASSMAALISAGFGDMVAYLVLKLLRTPVSWAFFIKDILPLSLIWSFVLIIPVNLLTGGVFSLVTLFLPDGGKKKLGRINHETRL